MSVTPTVLEAFGIRITLPKPWEGRLYRRDDPTVNDYGELAHPVLHIGNFSLPAGRGDYGSGAVDMMDAHGAFAALLEFAPEEAQRSLFAARGLPRLLPADFAPDALQRRLPNQAGCQRFFTTAGRPFCLYAVLGSRRNAPQLVPHLMDVLARLRIQEQ